MKAEQEAKAFEEAKRAYRETRNWAVAFAAALDACEARDAASLLADAAVDFVEDEG